MLVKDAVFTRNSGLRGASMALLCLIMWITLLSQYKTVILVALPGDFTPSCKEQAVKHHADALRVLNTKFVNNSAISGAGLHISLLNKNIL